MTPEMMRGAIANDERTRYTHSERDDITAPHAVERLEPARELGAWEWRRCRSIGIGLQCWLWPWRLDVYRFDDYFGGSMTLNVGPIVLQLHYNNGEEDAAWRDR